MSQSSTFSSIDYFASSTQGYPSGTFNPSVITGPVHINSINPGTKNELLYNTTGTLRYYWRVRACDATHPCSSATWYYGGTTTTMPGTYFATATKSWPSPSFTLDPANVLLGRPVTFKDTSICYDASNTAQSCVTNGNRTYLWSYGDGATCDSAGDASCKASSVTHLYSTVGTKTANLQVCDSPGTYCCSTSYLNNVTVKTNLTTPTWKEISPFQ
ncbi:MAG: PKD domain-containing protein [Candidatus Staskawiczbacteria bacterium]|nr:PKD domain-containing protein [Candidatus Staskawiczbacteria bacterium]